MQKYGNRESFLAKFNPSAQYEICTSDGNCFFGEYPTLDGLRVAYGNNAPVMWLIPQLFDLSEYSGCGSKMNEAQLEECATVITQNFGFLKVSEFMLFMWQFKSGRYGRFYGSIDPLIITVSLRDFLRERFYAHERRQREQKEKEDGREANARAGRDEWAAYCKDMEARLRADGKDEEADGWKDRPYPLDRFQSNPRDDKKKQSLGTPNFPLLRAKSLLTALQLFEKDYRMSPQEYIQKHSKTIND